MAGLQSERTNATVRHETRRLAVIAGLTALACALTGALAVQSIGTPVWRFDEPLWFARSTVTPADVSTRERQFWAIDVPGLNRWVYWTVLTLSNLKRVQPDEAHCWRVLKDKMYWQDGVKPYFDAGILPQWERAHGAYAPPRVIEAMRFTNIAAFVLGLALLYAVAWRLSRSHAVSLVAVLPLVLSPLFALKLAFVTSSGDILLFTTLALVLWLWTWKPAPTFANVLIVGAACGLAVSAKHPGVLALGAYSVWLVWQSRGWRRILNPAIACGTAFLVFAALNPVVFLHPEASCLRVLATMSVRRAKMAEALTVSHPMTIVTALSVLTPYWALVPLNIFAAIRAIRNVELAPLVLWSVVLWVGTILAYWLMGAAMEFYLGPVEYGLFFPTAVLCLWPLSARGKTPAR